MRKYFVFALFFLLYMASFSEFSKITKLENSIFGYTFENQKSILERVEILEKTVTGDISEGGPKERMEKLNALLEKDGDYLSLNRKLEIAEQIVDIKKIKNSSMLDRIEKIEQLLYNKIENGSSINGRISSIFSFIFENRREITITGDIFKTRVNARIKFITIPDKIRTGDSIKLILANDISGVAKSGSKISGKAVSVFENDNKKEITLILDSMTNEDNKDIIIYKKVKIKIGKTGVEESINIEDIGIIG